VSTVVSVITPSGKGGKDVELPPEFFGVKVSIPLIHQVVVAQQAAARQGSHATKTRGAVRGGGRKPYRQKGTGRARQGSLRAPQYAGGGTVHGPVPRSYVQRTPRKMKAAALRGALSDRTSHGRVSVVSGFVEGEEPSTSGALAVLRAAIGETHARLSRSVLVVASAGDELTRKSLRNAAGVNVLATGQLNTYDVLVSDHVVFTQAALSEFTGRGGDATPAARPGAPVKPARTAAEDAPAKDGPAKAKPAAKAKQAAEGAPAKDTPAKDMHTPAKDTHTPAKDTHTSAKDTSAKDTPAKAKPAAKGPAGQDEAAAGDSPASRRTRAARGTAAASGDKPEEEQQ
jgi:large subunit ribosomal protein L4